LHPDRPLLPVLENQAGGVEARFIELAGYINGQMPRFVVDKVADALNQHTKPVRGSHIHLLGVAYKRDIDDIRESPALDIAHMLQQRGARVTFSDPYVKEAKHDGFELQAMAEKDALETADCVVIVTDHRSVDYGKVGRTAKLIVDTRNAMKGVESENIVRL
jgi:UDP-N-acetyl-D-glucosamine dehydrogenase